jgi:hypothetical protein
MSPTRSLLPAVCSSLFACGSGHPTPAEDPDARTTEPQNDARPFDLHEVTERASAAICGALFRCCDDDLVEYFRPYVADERLAAFQPRLPPAATLDENQCRGVLREMLDELYLGAWVDAASAGEVTFMPGAFDGCVAALDAATCGPSARAALWDSTCFGIAPPSGGESQRAFVQRTRGAGASCAPVQDGLGGVFYGTCDPAVAFCCYQDPARPGCQFPFGANGAVRPGMCQAVAAVGQACSAGPPLALCATGMNCDAESSTCVDPPDDVLAIGATCIDASYNLLGTCSGGWCDILGSKRCEALRADGATCGGSEECSSGFCRSTCQPDPVCTADPPGLDAGVDAPPVDAGVDAPPSDASIDGPVADAGVDAPAADGERCDSALGLLASSVPSPATGFTHRIADSFGASNDYNPYRSAVPALPPSCSIVYDARGRERVYAITLQPGQRLQMRAELAGGRQAALYLLDTCPGGSWPDFDGSGACGNNEYGVGFCGPVGCDAATLSVTYPATLGGNPTQPAVFWVVVDQVGNDDATGFTLDWKLISF